MQALKSPPLNNRMSLANVRSGRMQSPLRLLIYGVPKVGKSTTAAGAPKPIFLGADAGTEQLDVERLPQPETWEDVHDALRLLQKEKHDYQTLVIDPANFLEPLAHARVIAGTKWTSIEQYEGGFFKGYGAAADLWRVLLSDIERLWQRGMNIVFLAHAGVTNFKNPEGPDYQRYTPAMDARVWGLLAGWVDAVLFARVEAFAKAEGRNRAKGFSTGMRVLHTTWSAPWEAGNRWSLPETIPLGWSELTGAIAAAEAQGEELRKEIAALAALLGGDAPVKARGYVNEAGSRVDKLREILNALEMKVSEKEGGI